MSRGALRRALWATLVPLRHRALEVRLTAEAKRWIVEQTCTDRSYGARPLRRALQKYVEDPLSEALIQGRLAGATEVEVFLDSNNALAIRPLLEAGLVGVAGGLLGLLLTNLGINGLRSLVSQEGRALLHLDAADVWIAVALGALATIVAGIYPTWRTARLQPARQLKTL